MKTLTTKRFGRLNPLNDFLFCKVMGEKGSEVQLLGFLNAVLGRTGNNRLASVEIIENKILSAEVIGDKSSILDVRAVLEDRTKVNIEVQLRNLHNMDKRSLFYWSKEFSKSLKSGQDYGELPTTIAINIVNFEFLDAKNFHTVFHLREDKESALILTDVLEIHFIDMVKWRRLGSKDIRNDPLHRWLTWFDKSSSPELVAEVIDMDSAILEAERRQAYLSGDEELIRAYEMREMALSDLASMKKYDHDIGYSEGHVAGQTIGHAEGYSKGLEEGQRRFMELLNQGLSVEEIKQRLEQGKR
ncbi:MAG: Rpn family recombination-promoting nuclease/putative transposase [Treponema sp.]|nr:Rpn family recombination-promoting nuclease/putative transposase [Treponema sp.]